MNVHDALLAAADHIEAHPGQFRFAEASTPLELEDCGCAIGWVGYFSGKFRDESPWIDCGVRRFGIHVDHVATALFEIGHGSMDARTFYERMTRLSGDWDWKRDAKLCAQTMRAYAAKYHAHEPPTIPASVRAIFETPAPVEPDPVPLAAEAA